MSETREREQPFARPTVASVRELLSSEDRMGLDEICHAFDRRMFIGKLVVQWCGQCGKWRPHYVPKEKVDEIFALQQEKPEFTLEPEIFPCIKCRRKLKMNIDEDHTILETKT